MNIITRRSYFWGPVADVPVAVDVHETAGSIIVKADLPGIDRKDLDVSVEGSVLVLRGEKKEAAPAEGSETVRTERVYGSFARILELPVEVDEARVSAQYKDGVLEVTLPKREEAKSTARRVEVK